MIKIGQTYKTKKGQTLDIIFVSEVKKKYPIVAILDKGLKTETCNAYTLKGQYIQGRPSRYDMIIEPVFKKGEIVESNVCNVLVTNNAKESDDIFEGTCIASITPIFKVGDHCKAWRINGFEILSLPLASKGL